MKQLILLCSNLHIEAFAQYITSTFRQEADMPGLAVRWSGKTARHDIGLIVIEWDASVDRDHLSEESASKSDTSC
jgi:hypothetical protein